MCLRSRPVTPWTRLQILLRSATTLGQHGAVRVIPPVLYLPARPGATSDHAEIELRRLVDGRVALLAYTALDRLGDGCGPDQPWVLYRTSELGVLRVMSPYDVILLDQPLPESARHQPAAETGMPPSTQEESR